MEGRRGGTNEALTLRRLRAFLLGLAAVLLVGTVAELLLAGHTESPVQLVPFLLCAMGLVAVGAVWARPGPRTVLALRVVMAAVALGSLVGVSQHLAGNLAFGQETQPGAGATRLLVAALTGGNPLLAPGVLALAAAVASAATYTAGDRPEGSPPATGA